MRLAEAEYDALNGVLKTLQDNPTYTADVVGYTDGEGQARSNVTLSWNREESVRRYLVEKGASLNRFTFIGLGEDVTKGDVRGPFPGEGSAGHHSDFTAPLLSAAPPVRLGRGWRQVAFHKVRGLLYDGLAGSLDEVEHDMHIGLPGAIATEDVTLYRGAELDMLMDELKRVEVTEHSAEHGNLMGKGEHLSKEEAMDGSL